MSLEEAVAGLSGADHLLVASDYDGTLARIVHQPHLAVPSERAHLALIRIAASPKATMAVVSGRTRAELIAFLGEHQDLILIGEHGNESDGVLEDGTPGNVAEIVRRLEAEVERVPGSWIEVKRYSAAFHHRNSELRRSRAAVTRLKEWADRVEGLVTTEGKRILELSTTGRNKGDAVVELRDQVHADVVVFVGDDTTDEHVFELLRPGDLGVKVGPGQTRAKYRIPDVEAVGDLLEAIHGVLAADERSGIP